MKKYLQLLLLIIVLGCKNETQVKSVISFDQGLADELTAMVVTDQLAASNAFPPEQFKNLNQEEWEAKKDSIYSAHKNRLKEMIDTFGYPGYDRVGKAGEGDFWLMVQHADHDPEFQNMVLKKLKIEVAAGNANGENFGLLTDRVRINTGKKQVYGTQVTYNPDTHQAIPRPLEDSLTVNERRKTVGLGPIEEYLNAMTVSHYQMNKEYLNKIGILEPALHLIKSK